MSRDPRIDAYIDRAAPFAQPILRHLRDLVHEACPDVEETMKWGMPYFMYQGMMCGMSSFKAHAAFGFWKGTLVLGESAKAQEAMGSFGRITALHDLPGDAAIRTYVKAAMKLNEEGIAPARPRSKKPDLPLPDDFRAALKKAKQLEKFEASSPSHRREYIEWITEARTDATRERRMATAVEWIREGKGRNWKYQ